VYRGKPAGWEPEKSPVGMVNVHAAEEPAKIEVSEVAAIRRKAAAMAGGRTETEAPKKPAKAKLAGSSGRARSNNGTAG
jgi:hypothetical protein